MHWLLSLLIPIFITATFALPATIISAEDSPKTSLKNRREVLIAWVGAFQNNKCKGPAAANRQTSIKKNHCYKWTPQQGAGWVGIDYGSELESDESSYFDAVLFFTDDSCTHSGGKKNYVHRGEDVALTENHSNGGPATGMMCVSLEEQAQSFMPLLDQDWAHENDIKSPHPHSRDKRGDGSAGTQLVLSLYTQPGCAGKTAFHNKEVVPSTAYNSVGDIGSGAKNAKPILSYYVHNYQDKGSKLKLYSDAACTESMHQSLDISGNEKGCSTPENTEVMCVEVVA